MQLRAEGKHAKEIAEEVGVSASYVSQLAAKYFAGEIEAIAGNHYGGNRRNMNEQKKVDHKISSGQIYLVLRRHGWRKIMPRSRHPKKAKAL